MPPAATVDRWDATRVPDQAGRRVVITGATSGIGRQAAVALAGSGASVTLAVRDVPAGRKVADAIRAAYPAAHVDVRHLDLADLASIEAFATALTAELSRLDLLIDNAGVMFAPRAATADGFELHIGTNHLGHFALTGRLMPRLAATPGSRIVVVSSAGHALARLDVDDLNWEVRRYNRYQAYFDSKLANLLFAYELARRFPARSDQPRVVAAHPGWSRTALHRHSLLMRVLNLVVGQSVEMGTLPILRAATDPAVEGGQFIGPAGRWHLAGPPIAHDSTSRSHDATLARRLWTISESLTGVRFPSTGRQDSGDAGHS